MDRSFINFLCLTLLLIFSVLNLFSLNRNNLIRQSASAQEFFTGAAPDTTANPNEQAATLQRSALRELLPVETDDFTIIYDYQLLKFVVTFSPPIETSQAKFRDWMTSHNFTDIETDKIEFINQ